MKAIQNQAEQFRYNDKIRKVYLKKLVRLFSAFGRKMGQLSFDELNALTGVSSAALQLANKLYDELDRLMYEYFYALTEYYYGYVTGKKAENGYFHGEIDDFYGEKREIEFAPKDFVDKYLESYNPLTKYLFYPEVERKKSRLVESVIAVQEPQKTKGLKVAAILLAIGTAQRLLTRQMLQYGDCITLVVTHQAYKDAGVLYVMWHTQEDLKVCATCEARDNQIYAVDDVPEYPAHYNCRCFLTPVSQNTPKMRKKSQK